MSVLCLIAIYVTAQSLSSPQLIDLDIQQGKPQEPKKPQDTIKGQTKIVEIVKAKTHQWKRLQDVHVLKDSVIFFHDGAYLYCDSAYYYSNLNSFEAFNNVRMEQGDTLFLYGKYMHYDGNTRLVKVRQDVSMVHSPQDGGNPVTLFTDSLNYERNLNLGYYFDGGLLVDSLNELTSFWGQYEPNINLATFKDSVILTNANFTLYSDQLKYNTDSRLAFFSTPTTIVSDSGVIHTTNGWYNTATEEALLLDQSQVINKQGDRILTGDSISYNKQGGYGEVFGNMFLQDTTNHTILRGHYGFYNELTNYAFATDSAFCIEYSQGDSLYIHADTLKLITIIDSTRMKIEPIALTTKIPAPNDSSLYVIDSMSLNMSVLSPIDSDSIQISVADSLSFTQIKADSLTTPSDSIQVSDPINKAIAEKPDTVPKTYRMIKAYYGVRFYRSDMQGVCDSLQFNSKDSIIHMYKDPILWNGERQLSGDTIDIFMNDSTIDRMHIKRYAYSIEKKDSIHFNQLKSRSLKIFFENKKTKQVLAEGNVETIAYPEERDGTLNGIMNWLQSSYLRITMNDGQFQRLVVWPKPVGKAYPFHLIKEEELRLSEFFWYDYLRPLDKDDIFRKAKKRAGDSRPPRPSIFTDSSYEF
ncbi:MAG: hypothetical protein LBV43_03145 [Prevotella sp.]|jgi:lipopolysaccharide export system protein LptA|nr:hypothetical protein [Prevotella sp.]